MARLSAAVVAAALFAAIPWPALAAAAACAPRDDILARLAEQYDERPIGVGLTSSGALMELLVSPDGRTWTIILSLPDGQSCLVTSGESWQEREPEPQGEPV